MTETVRELSASGFPPAERVRKANPKTERTATLPTSVRERFAFCFGEMEGCNICPMVREGVRPPAA